MKEKKSNYKLKPKLQQGNIKIFIDKQSKK